MAPFYFPFLRLEFFAPFLVIACYQRHLRFILWSALLCGLILDIFCSKTPLGFNSLILLGASFACWKQKGHFFADTYTTLPIMTGIFSFVATMIQTIVWPLFGNKAQLGPGWFFTDGILFPFLDATFAVVVFTLPALFLGKRPRRADEYFE